jgi:hypothetical protein
VPSRAVQGVVGFDIAADITDALAELGLIDDYERYEPRRLRQLQE